MMTARKMIRNGKNRTHNHSIINNYFSSGLHKKQFTFFRPSEYISQDFKQYGVSKEKTESRIDVKEKFKDDEIIPDDIRVKWNGGMDEFSLDNITYWRDF